MISIPSIFIFSGCGKSPDDLYRHGMILIKMDRTFLKGLKSLRKFEKKFPNDSRTPDVALTYALANQTVRRFDESIETYKRIFENYPGTEEAYKSKFLLGYLYYDELNDTSRATIIFEDFLKEFPGSELSVSAEVILRNIDLPIEEWSIMKEFGFGLEAATAGNKP
jgi:outer membrane protein assembly factor BamD (BamD/ComL family)